MARSDVIILLRKLLKRMEEEEWTLDEKLGSNVEYKGGFKEYQANGRDTYTLKFNGPKRESHIPLVTIVWEDGYSERRSYRQVRGIQRNGERPVYKYCAIKLEDIEPSHHRENVRKCFLASGISYIGENDK